MNGLARAVAAVSREPAAREGQLARPPVIQVRRPRKSYDSVEAVAGIDLAVRASALSGPARGPGRGAG